MSNRRKVRTAPCVFCDHWDLPIGCPYMDADGNLIGETECPSLCGKPATHLVVLPIGTIPTCGEHFKVAMRMVGDEEGE